jgi:hypothetical protein
MRLILVLPLLAACPGAAHPTVPSGADGPVDVACVLVPDGGLCTFTATSAGSRCIKLLYGSTAGTVVSSNDICSGPLAAHASATLAVRFPTRPGDACGTFLSECESRPVAPATALDTAAAWQAELKQSFSGALTEADCKKLNDHKYEIYVHADCDAVADPVQRDSCYRNVKEEREREMPYLVQDCIQYYKRARFTCEIKAKDANELYACETRYPD